MKIRIWFYNVEEINSEYDLEGEDILKEDDYNESIIEIVGELCDLIGDIKDTQCDTALYNGGEQRFYYDIETGNTIKHEDMGGIDSKIGIIEGAQINHCDTIYSYEFVEEGD
jgi:hypothetical protein